MLGASHPPYPLHINDNMTSLGVPTAVYVYLSRVHFSPVTQAITIQSVNASNNTLSELRLFHPLCALGFCLF